MKSLLEYLILEAKNDKEKGQLPSGYEEIDNRGAITAMAQAAIGGTIKAASVAAATSDGKLQIIKQLKATVSKTTIWGVISGVALAENELDALLDHNKMQPIGSSGIEIKLVGDWQALAGAPKSSLKLIKFWMKSALIAYGAPYIQDDVVYAYSKDNGGKLLIQLRSELK